MHRFFFSVTRRENDTVSLDEAEARHAVQVLRLKKGAGIVLLDGLGGVFDAVIESAAKQPPAVRARITGTLPDREARTRVTLYQGLPKADKIETILQKCTEIGVHAVQPVVFERSVKAPGKNADKALERMRRVVREATKQCGRGQMPLVGQSKPLDEVIDRIAAHQLVLLPWEEADAEAPHLRDVLGGMPDAAEIAVVIGPEGGITPAEAARLTAAGARVVTLGPRILRTETAGMAALSAILALRGDL